MPTNVKAFINPREELINRITSDRQSFYNYLGKQCPVCSEELNAWMIFDHGLIKSFLNDKRFTANRKEEFIKRLNLDEKQENILCSFYSRWLMYMEC
ncbi:hypothetical protein QS257_21140 [Terrilactibacillus sp. S3-3]|nr:hypothetical protein QS257_21140 [Terrilactibacillus sp. S3-3]